MKSDIGLNDGEFTTPLTTNENEEGSEVFKLTKLRLILGEITEHVEEHETEEISKSDGNLMDKVPVGV